MSKSSFKSLFRALDTQARDYPEAGSWGLSRKMVPIFQVGFGYARSLVSLGLEGCAGRIEAIVHAEVMSSVSWQAHIPHHQSLAPLILDDGVWFEA